MSRMQGKVALVSGGAEGIGAAVARLIVAEGGSVILVPSGQVHALRMKLAAAGLNVGSGGGNYQNQYDYLPLIDADATRLRQILINLLSNAVKFTPPSGRVAIHVIASEGGGVVVAVVDTGIGIKPVTS